jgi:hypothetical protein
MKLLSKTESEKGIHELIYRTEIDPNNLRITKERNIKVFVMETYRDDRLLSVIHMIPALFNLFGRLKSTTAVHH